MDNLTEEEKKILLPNRSKNQSYTCGTFLSHWPFRSHNLTHLGMNHCHAYGNNNLVLPLERRTI